MESPILVEIHSFNIEGNSLTSICTSLIQNNKLFISKFEEYLLNKYEDLPLKNTLMEFHL